VGVVVLLLFTATSLVLHSITSSHDHLFERRREEERNAAPIRCIGNMQMEKQWKNS